MLRKQHAKRSIHEGGMAAPSLLLIAGGVVFVWFVFLGILDIIGSRHHNKVKERMDRFASYHKKPPPPVKRNVNGYQVKY